MRRLAARSRSPGRSKRQWRRTSANSGWSWKGGQPARNLCADSARSQLRLRRAPHSRAGNRHRQLVRLASSDSRAGAPARRTVPMRRGRPAMRPCRSRSCWATTWRRGLGTASCSLLCSARPPEPDPGPAAGAVPYWDAVAALAATGGLGVSWPLRAVRTSPCEVIIRRLRHHSSSWPAAGGRQLRVRRGPVALTRAQPAASAGRESADLGAARPCGCLPPAPRPTWPPHPPTRQRTCGLV